MRNGILHFVFEPKGYYGDKIGRKHALLYSIVIMTFATTGIGLLPSYETIGVMAPITLVFLRILQGISGGGEFTGSLVLITEFSPANKRGYYGSFSYSSAQLGLLLGSLAAVIISYLFSPTIVEAWAWRIPFIFCLLLGYLGYQYRKNLNESPQFLDLKNNAQVLQRPLTHALKNDKKSITLTFGINCIASVSFYLFFIYLVSHLSLITEIPYSKIVIINSINMLILICLIPFFGYLSDKIGRKLLVMTGTILTAVTAYPVFTAILSQSLFIIFLIQLACAISLALILGPIPALLSEQFYTSTRYTGLSFGFNISAAILGGTTPLLCTFLVAKFANPVAPSFYLIFSALISLIFIYLSKEKRNQLLK